MEQSAHIITREHEGQVQLLRVCLGAGSLGQAKSWLSEFGVDESSRRRWMDHGVQPAILGRIHRAQIAVTTGPAGLPVVIVESIGDEVELPLDEI